MDKYLLGIDNGGSDIKCALFNTEGRQIAVASCSLDIDSPETGFSERNSEEVWQANAGLIRQILEQSKIDPADILSIGITAYGNGLVFVDENIREVYPAIVSTDGRANELCQAFKNNGTERTLYPLTRQTIWSAQPAALLPWFKANRPDILRKTRYILSMKDFIRYKLTGQLNGELTEASSTGLMNLTSRQYDPYIFHVLGIDECLDMFPPVLKSTAIAGRISEEAEKQTGLKQGAPVAAGYFDIDANALASGILNDSELCLIAGTWSINEFLVGSVTDNYDKRTNIATLSYMENLYLMEDSAPTSAGNFAWYIRRIIKQYAPDISDAEIYRLCNEQVNMRGPEESDVIFIPYIYGSATHPFARGAFLNISAKDDHVSLLRAIYEGVVFSSIHHVRNLKRPIESYSIAKLSGGLSNSPVWSQMMADALQIPIQTIEGSQIGARGAAIGAGVACGVFEDLKQGVEVMVRPFRTYIPRKRYAKIYAEKYERYEKALQALDQLAESLQEV